MTLHLALDAGMAVVGAAVGIYMGRHHERERRRRLAVLRALACYGPMRGQQLKDARPKVLKAGTIYVTLSRMEDDGLLTSEPDTTDPLLQMYPTRPPRRRYSITDKGIDYIAVNRPHVDGPYR